MNPPTDFIYTGFKDANGDCTVRVSPDGSSWAEDLPLRRDLYDHSEGFAWGYHGSGPAQLALALLAHHLESRRGERSDEEKAARTNSILAMHQNFKGEVIARLGYRCSGWIMKSSDIHDWISDWNTSTIP